MNNTSSNITLGFRRKRFTIDGDENRILEIDITDMATIGRFDQSTKRIDELGAEYVKLGSLLGESFDAYSKKLEEIDTEMRSIVDHIFDAPVCEVCAPSGTMFDPVNGKLKFEIIIDAILSLYESEMSTELKKISDRVKEHTKKYTAKKSPTHKK